uniref:Uncharacterized protein n=1 Tax=Arundo donax TaxID=35708 RepID=A0A0A9HD92_ARUDO
MIYFSLRGSIFLWSTIWPNCYDFSRLEQSMHLGLRRNIFLELFFIHVYSEAVTPVSCYPR